MAVELVGGAFLSSMFQAAFDRLVSSEVVDYLRGNNISDDLIHELKIVILAVNAVLDDAQRKQITNIHVKNWLDELETISYEADDLLDEIATDARQSDLEASGSRKSKKCKLSNFILSFFFRRSYNQDMKKKMEDILRRFKVSEEKITTLRLINKTLGETPSPRQPTTSLIEKSEVFGRDGDKEEIVNLLLADGGSNKVSVIPITGMGGIGKTTLAQLAYNDHAVEKHFNLKSWVYVSEKFDSIEVTKTVLCAVTESNSDSYDDRNLDVLQNKLKEGLTGKKFLIVLDDVWNEYYIGWHGMRTLLQFGAHGSKIIVTARNKDVADIMGTTTHFQLEHLKDEDCWQIFQKHAFDKIRDSSSVSQVLEKIGREIVKKCKGLPLAAKTLGGLLRSKEDVSEWERVLKSEIWDFSHEKSKILPALLLSYNFLPSHLKPCFAFCSTFPKDYEFRKNELVLLWMAENLLPQASINKRVEDVGNEYFNELVSRSFFQRTSIGEESRFVMHDLVHDVARFVSRGYCFSFESGNSDGNMINVRHLAVASDVSLDRYGAISKASHLRSFLSTYRYSVQTLSNQVVNNVILKFRRLRILSLRWCQNLEQLSDSIGELKHLRFLDLSWTSIKRLPNSVSRLYNLQTLKLSGCAKLIELPEDMYHLINLRHLDITYCRNLKEMPRQIGDLKSLQTLSTFIVGEDNGAKIEELRGLSDLHGELHLQNLQNVASATDASEARLMDKNYLQWVHLFWNVNATDDTAQRAHANVMIHHREVLEKLLPHTNLERLSIYGYGGTSFPYWLGDHSFCNIVSIKLKNCRCCNSLPPLGQLPSLKTLEIEGLSGVVTVGAEFKGNIGGSSITKPFASLEFLSFRGMSAWKEWSSIGVEDGEVFTKLKKLHINQCKKLRFVDWPDSLPCLTELEIEDYGSELALESSLPRTPALDKLRLGVCEKLRLEELPQTVESIHIGGNNGLESLIEAFNKGQTSFLKKLHIRNCRLAITLIPECLPATLTELEIIDCKKLEFPMQCSLKNSSIRRVQIWRSCDSLRFFPLDFAPNLISLSIWNCENLESLGVSSDGDGMLTSLSEIYIGGCPNFVSFPKGGLRAPNLTTLRVEDCKKLKKLPEQMRNLLPFLNILGINNCPKLESLPEGGLPSNLDTLEVWNCPKLIAQRMKWNLHAHQALKKFTIGGECEGGGVELFPEEGLLPSTLSSLCIGNFPHLKRLDIKGIQQFTSLEGLQIYGCPQLEKLPQQGLPTSLKVLEIAKCPLLERCQREDWNTISHIPYITIDDRRIRQLSASHSAHDS
ncbi:putative disease resistance protein At3g14460 [Ziziphus jujuba]|uniref:Disease resistance protein At3g14460 n=1 Tax=Ziziphus jujuba TaxID=326968 RepID=A0ABM3I1Y8_ZIZJJ|nr:putative disease resistance protein At3g14460 [Ziziphus jujuba]